MKELLGMMQACMTLMFARLRGLDYHYTYLVYCGKKNLYDWQPYCKRCKRSFLY